MVNRINHRISSFNYRDCCFNYRHPSPKIKTTLSLNITYRWNRFNFMVQIKSIVKTNCFHFGNNYLTKIKKRSTLIMSKALFVKDTIFTYKALFVKDKTVWCTSKRYTLFYYLEHYMKFQQGEVYLINFHKKVGMNFTENTTL